MAESADGKGEKKRENSVAFSEHLILIKRVLEVATSSGISGEPNPNVRAISSYVKILNAIGTPAKRDEHLLQYRTIYENNRAAILLGEKNDVWLSAGSLSLVLKDSVKPTPGKLLLSSLYNIAVRLRNDIPEEKRETQRELMYPDIILLHIYRIFREVAPGSDYVAITKTITSLESELGLDAGDVSPGFGLSEMMSSGGLSRLMGVASKAINTQLKKADPERKDIDLSKVIEDLTESGGELQDILGSTVKAAKDGSDMEKMIERLTESDFLDRVTGKITSAVAGKVDPVSDGASSSSSAGGGAAPPPLPPTDE